MASKRAERIQAKLVGKQSTPASRKDKRAEQQRVRRATAKYKNDFKLFYREVLAPQAKNKRTGKFRADSLGRFHDFLIDFLNLSEPEDVVRYSRLNRYLPPRSDDGLYQERWIYFRTLDSEPVIEDVYPDSVKGPVRTMFEKQFWQGLLIKIAGDALTKCILAPRGHLKSTICTQDHTCWQITRAPHERHMVLTLTSDLAASMVSSIKSYFEANDRFRKLYAHMGPPEKREGVWNAEKIQCHSEEYGWRSVGKEATLEAYGLGTEATGKHCEHVKLDDVVGKTNFRGQPCRDACSAVEQCQSILDNGGTLTDVGTRWNEDDPHSMFLSPDASQIALDSSFLIATALDGDTEVPAPRKLTPLEYGKPIFPEVFTLNDLLKKRRGIRDDRWWYGQYFNQFIGTGLRTFARDWITRYTGSPLDACHSLGLDVYIAVDTASGKREQQGRLDFSACVVLGQTRDRMNFYLLDGFKEKLPADKIARAIVDMVVRWRERILPGRRLVAGFEETSYTNFLAPLMDSEWRRRGEKSVFPVESLKHNNVEKFERVRKLAQPYSERRFLWPESLSVIPVDGGEPYDLLQMLEEEYQRFPGGGDAAGVDDMLDAMAYAHEMAPPRPFFLEDGPAEAGYAAGRYSRADAKKAEQDRLFAGIEEPEGGYSLV